MDKSNLNGSSQNDTTSVIGSSIQGTSIAIGKEAKASTTNQWGSNPAQASADLVAVLEKLREQFAQARQAGIVDETAVSVVTATVKQAQQSNPDKKTIIDRLNAVKVFIEDITAASGLVTAIVETIKVVQRLF
jgi:cell fate (sporulation/competence/biofilm development) regulator YlbF (YheA/YmcA/DUF963 family)